jgi:hypothetical protein
LYNREYFQVLKMYDYLQAEESRAHRGQYRKLLGNEESREILEAAVVGFEPTDRVFPVKVRPDQAIISRPH